MRGCCVLLLAGVAACSGDDEERTSPRVRRPPAATTLPGEADRPPAARARRHDEVATVESEESAATQDDQRKIPSDEWTRLTPETLEAALRAPWDRGDVTTFVATIRGDEGSVRAAIGLLEASNDRAILDGLRRVFAQGALRGHEAAVDSSLYRALRTDGEPMRRLAALEGLGLRRGLASEPLRAEVFERLPTECAPEVVQEVAAALQRATLTLAERTALIACAQRLDVPFENSTPARHPARHARRDLYEQLAADAVRRDDWGPLLARMDALRSDCEREDLIAGLAVTGDYLEAPDPGAVGSAERRTLLATRRENLSRIYRATNGTVGRRRMISTARSGLGILPDEADAPEEERVAAAALLRDLIAFETDPDTIAALRGAISHMGMGGESEAPR